MIRSLRVVLGLISLLHPLSGSAQGSDADALKLLQGLGQKYARATRSQIESVTETRSSGDYDSSWRKVLLTGYEAPGNRYRFGGRNSSGLGLVVSDGTTEWEFHEAFGEYVKRPAGTFGHPLPQTVTQFDGPGERDAYFLRSNLGFLGDRLKTAHWRPEETVLIGNRKIACLVVSFGSEDYPSWDSQDGSFEESVWIDKERKLIVKTERVGEGKALGAPHADTRHTIETVIYPVMSLDEPIPPEVFTFSPPPGAKLVDSFTDPVAKYRRPASTARQSAPLPQPDYIGTPAPNLVLTSADGKTLDLASLRGNPVLIDLWATWCGPCLMEMPTIDRIFRYARPAGLYVLGIDQDRNPADAPAYLKNRNYEWPDYHDGKDGKYTGVGLKTTGIPVLLLIDASGKIAYFHPGADDEPGLLAAVRHLGPAFASAMDETEK